MINIKYTISVPQTKSNNVEKYNENIYEEWKCLQKLSLPNSTFTNRKYVEQNGIKNHENINSSVTFSHVRKIQFDI